MELNTLYFLILRVQMEYLILVEKIIMLETPMLL